MIDQGSRILIEQIAARTDGDLPVLIEMTASRHGASPGRDHVDAINYFEGVIERLDRALPSGWSRSPTWSELDRGRARKNAPRRLYLYVQTRIGLADLRRIDTEAAELARSMNLRYGLAMAPGIAMTSSEIARHGVDAARSELLRLIPDGPDRNLAPGRCSVRARWIGAGRRPQRARLYLTLLPRRSTARMLSFRARPGTGRGARVSGRRVPQGPADRLAAGYIDRG
jgi:hypothetical protein